jgi:hypothetical protein
MKVLYAAMCLFAVAGCAGSVEPAAPLTVTAQVTPTSAARGDSITVVANVQGELVTGVTVDFGDGTVEEQGFGGVRTGKVTYRHAYDATGTFTITATVRDATDDQRTATATVQID